MSALPSQVSATASESARLVVSYRTSGLDQLLAEPGTLAVIGFGRSAPAAHDDPRYFNIGLDPWEEGLGFEVWQTDGRIDCGRQNGIAWAHSGALAFGSLALPEAEFGGIEAVSEVAYARLLDFVTASDHPQLLRSWNYIDAITEGEGDDERYRRFCLGRARGMHGRLSAYPAATAIGARDGQRVLRIYWLSARQAGSNVENPRQIAAYRYPRQYGPQPPSFSRATLAASVAVPLLISGTASVVGHASLHADDIAAQMGETFRNLDSLLDAARQLRPELPPALGAGSLLKAYVRDAADLPVVQRELASRLPPGTPVLALAADVCRRELRVEIDGFHDCRGSQTGAPE